MSSGGIPQQHREAFATEPCFLQWGNPGNQGKGTRFTNHRIEINTMRGCENQQQIFFLTQFSEQGQQQHYLKGRMVYEQRMKRWDFPAHGSKLLPAAELLQTHMKKKVRLEGEHRTRSWAFRRWCVLDEILKNSSHGVWTASLGQKQWCKTGLDLILDTSSSVPSADVTSCVAELCTDVL